MLRGDRADQRRWYVIQSKPQKEVLVCSQLSRLADQEVECFFPRIRNHLGIRPLFPSYLFVKIALHDQEYYRLLKYTRGILRVIGSREGPVFVPPEVVRTIQKKVGEDGVIDQCSFLSKGRAVRVRRGPLQDLIGILEEPASDGKRVEVLFQLLKYPLRAVLRFGDLELISGGFNESSSRNVVA